jgi:hypothetical protein
MLSRVNSLRLISPLLVLCAFALLAAACGSSAPLATPPPVIDDPAEILSRAQQSMDDVTSYRFAGQVESIADGVSSLGQQAGAWSSSGALQARFDSDGEFTESIVIGDRFFFRASSLRDGAWAEAEAEAANESAIAPYLSPTTDAELELLTFPDDAVYLLRWRLVSNVTPPLPVDTESRITRTETVDLLVDRNTFRVMRVLSDAVMRVELLPPDGGEPELEDEIVLRFEYNLSDFDEPVEIDPPI